MRRAVRALVAVLPLLAASAPVARAADPAVEAEADLLRRHARDPMEQDARAAAIRRLGGIGGEEAAIALVPLLDDPFVHLRDHAESAWVEMLRGPRGAETQTWLSSAGLSHARPNVRRAAAAALGSNGGPELVTPFREAVAREEDAGVIEALAQASLRLRGEPDLGEAFLEKLSHKDPRAAFAAASASLGKDPGRARAALLRLLQSRQPLARAGAVLALQRAGAFPAAAVETVLADRAVEPRIALAETLPWRTATVPWTAVGAPALGRLLAADSWRVRAAAVEASAAVAEADTVPLLIDRLAAEEGRLDDDVLAALKRITGKDLGDDPHVWRSWWAANASDFRREGPSADPFPGAPGESRTAAFFRLPVRSKRVAFLFDCSGSMGDPAPAGGTKMDLARREFERTLSTLADDVHFDVFLYRYPTAFPPRPSLSRALGRLTPAAPGVARKAVAWLAKEAPKGWGAFYDALVAVAADDEADTVFFLSDGIPSRGTYDRDFRLVEKFREANRFRRLVVHTVLVGTKDTDRRFLQDLAAATGGRFSDANVATSPR